MRMSVDKAAARASVDAAASKEEEKRRRREVAEECERIVESVRGEAAHQDDDTTPDALAYHVNTFELEVERFLEVESWNDQHGFEMTDQVEEEAVEEMKARQAAGDDRRSKIKKSFEEEDKKLAEMDKGIKNLAQRLEKVAEEAEQASKEEVGAGSAKGPKSSAPGAAMIAAGENLARKNPYSEYKAQLERLEAADKQRGGVDDAGVRSKVAALRAESELLRGCLKAGAAGRGSFEAYRNALAKRDPNT